MLVEMKIQSLALLVSALLSLVSTDCFAQIAQYGYGEPSEKITLTDSTPMRIRGIRNRNNKDFVIGGVFAVREDDTGVVCGKPRRDQWAEAMLFAIDTVNANESLLPNITLGFDIRDSCYSENIGLDETIDVIISGDQLDVESCDCESTNMGSTNASIPTVGIVGAAASRVSIPVAGLGRLFEVPQVSFASTSPTLSGRETYTYFYRTVPPDNLQAKAMIDIVLHFNWNYISIIFVGDAYGQPGARALRQLAMDNNICIDVDTEIELDFTTEEYHMLAETLIASDANVVILFSHDQNARLLLQEIVKLTSDRRFTWIASDGWARTLGLAHMFNETVAGYFGVTPHAPHVPSFDDYLRQLTIETNRRNAWFEGIISAYTSCNATNPCDRNISLTSLPNYAQDNFVPYMIDAVYAFANALHNYLKENCNFTSGWTWKNQRCPDQKRELDGPTLLEYLRRVDFTNSYTGSRVSFDATGSAAGNYEILNYQANVTNGVTVYGYLRVGTWSSSRINSSVSEPLELFENVTIQFGVSKSGGIVYQPPVAQCGRCSLGEYRRIVTSSCCGVCDPCLGRDYSDDPSAQSCKTCPSSNFTWGDSPTEGSSHCVPLPEIYLHFNHPWSIILLLLAICGLVGVAIATVVFAIYWNTPVIKSSGREQMVTLLIGITLSFVLPFIYLAPPMHGAVCVLQSIGVWLALSLMFGALLVKIVRVARIFFNKASLTHLRFTEFYYQILFTLALVLVQMILVVAAIAFQVPSVHREERSISNNITTPPEVVVTCDNNPLPFAIISILYESAILAAATILGVLSFKYPANFNEAKYISFCTFAVVVIWVAFIITYLAIEQAAREFQNAVIALGIIMTAFAVLLTIFGRKVFIVVFWREKNVVTYSTQHGRSRIDRNSVGDEHNTQNLRLSTLEPKLSMLESNGTDHKENKKGKVFYFGFFFSLNNF